MKKNYLSGLWLLLILLSPLLSRAQTYDPVFDPTHVYKIVNKSNGYALEVVGGRDEILVEGRYMGANPYWGLAKQQWYIQTTADGLYKIINRSSGKALSGKAYFEGMSIHVELEVRQYEPSGATRQKWTIIRTASNDGYAIASLEAGAEGSSIRVGNNTQVIQQPFGEAIEARWDIVDVSDNAGAYVIYNNLSNKALEVGGADLSQGAAVNQWSYFGAASQQWVIQPVSGGYFKILNRNTWQALEIGGSYSQTVSPGRNANQWPYQGQVADTQNENQQWSLLDINDSHQLTLAEAADGRVIKLYNRRSGAVLEIGGGDSEHYQDGHVANQWYDWSGPHQQWRIQFVSPN